MAEEDLDFHLRATDSPDKIESLSPEALRKHRAFFQYALGKLNPDHPLALRIRERLDDIAHELDRHCSDERHKNTRWDNRWLILIGIATALIGIAAIAVAIWLAKTPLATSGVSTPTPYNSRIQSNFDSRTQVELTNTSMPSPEQTPEASASESTPAQPTP